VLVGFSGDNLPRVSGLYAEGAIEAVSVNAVTLPEASITKAGDKAYAWRVSGKVLQRVDMQIGTRDQRTGNYEVRNGIKEGDIIMRNPNSSFKDGQSIEMLSAKLRVAAADTAHSGSTLAQGH